MINRLLVSYIILVFLVTLVSCNKPTEPQLFTKLSSSQSNVDFQNILPKDDSLNILDYLYYYNGGGVASGDIDNDGKVDLFFVSNRGSNKLYLNKSEKGQIKFDDITIKAGVAGKSNWKTGVSMADVNGDGWLDIYVCAVGNHKGIKGVNELYINNKDGSFSEKAAEYGLDFKGFSTQAAFFDYDKDGDLDCYLLTHAIHSVSSYDKVSSRALRDGEAGDHLYRNNTVNSITKFEDISEQSGIYGAAMGYGLGIVTADINNDGWEDIYVTNDFHEDDYYYINQKDGTFRESIKENFRHLSKYSMGCDVADVNNDGYVDIFTADMHPPDEKVEKLSLGEDAYDIYLYKLQFGFFNQYSRNCLQISQEGSHFYDISPMAGVMATDWSWSPLLADFDNDGVKDLFVSNGIPRRPNDLDYIKYLSSNIDSMVSKSIPTFAQKVNDTKAIEQMPEGKAINTIYKGTDGWKFIDKSDDWGFTQKTVSNGAVYADLDNDGDLDIITNDLNDVASIYQNNTNTLYPNTNFLRVKLVGNTLNTQGIGTKVMVKVGDNRQYLHQQNVRGFMSSVDPTLHFGVGTNTIIDSLIVFWNNDKGQVFTNIKANQTLTVNQADAVTIPLIYPHQITPNPLFREVSNLITATHRENDFIDFIREPLIPFLASTEGPKIAVGDVNGDNLDDLYQGGARNKPGQLLIQQSNGSFVASKQTAFMADSVFEDTDALFFDADNDKDLDIYVVSGGNEYIENMPESMDRLYLNDGKGNFTRKQNAIPQAEYPNKSCVRSYDFDSDGDLDLFVGGRVISSNYGIVPKSYLFVNDGKGNFIDKIDAIAPTLAKIGMVTDAMWVDTDKDGDKDLVVVGEWMGIEIFENNKGRFSNLNSILSTQKGFWHSIEGEDFDKDGDIDFVVGNLGTNTKYIKETNPVLRMYANDMDGNGRMEQIIAYKKDNKWYPAASRDDLARMAPSIINKRFPTYRKYAGKTIDELFEKEELYGKNALQYEVSVFESIYIENLGNNKFEVKHLPREAQVSKIFAMKSMDIDTDGYMDILIGGNLYGVSTYQGRYDASYGLILKGTKKGFVPVMPLKGGFVLSGEIRDIKTYKTKNNVNVVVARNNNVPQVFQNLQ